MSEQIGLSDTKQTGISLRKRQSRHKLFKLYVKLLSQKTKLPPPPRFSAPYNQELISDESTVGFKDLQAWITCVPPFLQLTVIFCVKQIEDNLQ